MDSRKEASNTDYNLMFNSNINLTVVGIFIFTLSFTTLKSFASSPTIGLVLLYLAIPFLLFTYAVNNNKKLVLSNVDLLWLFFLLLLSINIGFHNIVNPLNMGDLLVYIACVLLLILVKVDIEYFIPSIKLIKVFAIIYALSAIFQYLFTDLFLSYILPLFTSGNRENVLHLLGANSYTGFTTQTAHIAGYIVNGIGIIIFYNKNKQLFKNISLIVTLLTLFIGLLLTAKRAHLIFMIVSVLITYIISIQHSNFVKKMAKFVIVILTFIVITFSILTIANVKESPIISFVNELQYTFEGIINGEDVSTGRTVLFSYSWELFKENPLTGIGWREFINHSQGLIRIDTGSHPHNIYLQLLSETGIIVFLLFITAVFLTYYKTCNLLRGLIKAKNVSNWIFGIQYSIYVQTFFILYGLTGNPLTDHNFLLMYFLACSITFSGVYKFQSNLSSGNKKGLKHG